MHCALWPPAPESPYPLRSPAVLALASLVDRMLAEQHDRADNQPYCLFFEYCWRDRLFVSELVSQLFKLFEHQAVSGLPNVAHRSQ
jgi:hypothetical protein